MKLKTKFSTILLLFFASHSYGQMENFTYKRELQGINNAWHKVVLPQEIFGKVTPSLNDIRIYGLTSKNDTIEASYVLKLLTEKINTKDVSFKIINTSFNNQGYYFTFETKSDEAINQLKLNFSNPNFDWKIALEGSENQHEWFTIVDEYRILSIVNSETNYQFTNVNFPNSNYKYLRLLIKSNEKPILSTAKISLKEITNGNYNTYVSTKIKTFQKKAQQKTSVEIDLKQTVPVSYLKINVKNNFDFYRPITIEYLLDSVKTETGWIYNYQPLTSGTLNSIEKNEFKFESKLLNKIKISISNNDNEPLTIDSVTVKGYVHELVARFTEPGTYFLTYGNKNASKPTYDIERFTPKVLDSLTTLTLGKEQLIDKKPLLEKEPLFKNKNWLWAIMLIIILVLGWFSVKMMKSK